MKKAAIIQFEAVHEEIIPSVDFYLKSTGYDTCSYLNNNIYKRKGDFFKDSGFKKIKYNYVTIEKGSDWGSLKEKIKVDEAPDLLVLNTYQRKSVVNWSLDFDIPIAGIVHNPLLLLSVPNIKDILKNNKNIYLLGLAPHVASYLISSFPFMQNRIGFLDPIIWDEFSNNCNESVNVLDFTKKTLAIPGSINFSNRDYAGLIEQVYQAKIKGMQSDNVVIHFLGGGKDRPNLIELIKDKKIEEFFNFSEINEQGFVPYNVYLSDLKKASFLLPMFKPNDVAYRTYKISSVISSSVGNLIPLLKDNWTDIVYQTTGIVYDANLFSDKLLEVSLLGERDCLELNKLVVINRKNWISRSISQLARAKNYFNSMDNR